MALLNPGMAGAPQGLQAAYLRDPRLRLAQALQLQGADTSPVQHWTQGAARLAQALAGNYVQDRADRQYQEQADQYATERQSLYAPVMQQGAAGPGPRSGPNGATTRAATPDEMLARAQSLRSPYLQDDIRQIQQQAAAEAAKKADPMYGRVNIPNVGLVDMRSGTPQTIVPATQAPPASVAEFNFARQNGFTGDFMAFQQAKAQAGRAPEREEFEIKEIGGRVVAVNKRNPNQRQDLGPAGNGGAFGGNAIEAQHLNNVLNLQPDDPRYALSFNALYGPRVVERDGVPIRIEPPVPPGVRQPTFGQQPPAQVPGAPSQPQAPGMPPQAPPVAAPPGLPGAPPQMPPAGIPGNAQPGAAVRTELPGGGAVTRVTPPPTMTREERAKFDASIANAAQISNALDDYAKAFEGAGFGDRTRSALGFSTNLNTAFNGAALLAKGEELFNLGVLNGPDLDIIRRTLPDPSTGRGAFASGEDARRAADQVRRMLQDRLSAFLRQKGVDPIDIGAYGRSLRAETQRSSPPSPTIPPEAESILGRYGL